MARTILSGSVSRCRTAAIRALWGECSSTEEMILSYTCMSILAEGGSANAEKAKGPNHFEPGLCAVGLEASVHFADHLLTYQNAPITESA